NEPASLRDGRPGSHRGAIILRTQSPVDNLATPESAAGHRTMSHGCARRSSRPVFPLRTFRHLLQLVSQSPLSKMPGQRPPPLAGGAPPRVASRPLCACRFHSTAGTGTARSAEQEGDLRSPVPRQRRNSARSGPRSETSWRPDRFLQRAPHLGSEAPTSSPCPLRTSGWGAIRRSHALDPSPRLLLSSQQSVEPGVSRQVRGLSEVRLHPRQARLPWSPQTPCTAQNLLLLAPATVSPGLGCLLQTTLRRSGACLALSRFLHSPCRYLQPPTGLTGGRPSHVSLEGFSTSQPKAADDATFGGVASPGFVRIRNFGFLANRRRATFLPLCAQLLNAAAQSNPVTHPTPRTPPALAFWTCPRCGGPMRVIERLTAAQIQLRSPPL